MSIRIMSAVWDSKRYDSGTLLVLLAMADYANDDDHTCHPSIRRLADKSRLSRRQVLRIIDRLKTDGVITSVGEHAIRNGSPIVIYRINVETLPTPPRGDIDNTKGDTMSPLPPETVANVTPDSDIHDTPGVTSMSPLPPETVANVTPDSDIHDTPGVTWMSHDPLEEPSLGPSGDGGGVPPQTAAPEPPTSAIASIANPQSPIADQPWWEAEPLPAPAPPTTKNLTQQPPVAMYQDVFLRYPAKAQMLMLMAHGIDDLRRWRAVLQHWCGRGWNPLNIAGLLDLYDHPERIDDRQRPPAQSAAVKPALHPQAVQRTADGFNDWLAELSRTDNAHLHGAAS